MFQKIILILGIVLSYNTIFAKIPKKNVLAQRINTSIKIDGKLDEEIWQKASVATDFIQITPNNGSKSTQLTEVRIFYDNTAIYIGAVLLDNAPDSIARQLSPRDEFAISDHFGIYIDPYNDGLNAYGFFVSCAGVQLDLKANDNIEDTSWDAVWESDVQLNEFGWIAEIKIPYSALRFPKKKDQIWGINLFRYISRNKENTSWNLIDKNNGGFLHQSGELIGINSIEPPLRLSFTPYLSSYIEHNTDGNSRTYSFKGGLDVKYGINESYTLDMMLIPDFGQVQSDDKILNLSPFEVYYQEKRSFFMEGTELFNRGGIFYSRRIGSSPTRMSEVEDNLSKNEIINKNPSETQLLNATKISGKSKNGLGIGFLNAMTISTYAEVTDTITKENRSIETQPFTNYNIFVLDKSLPNNSYIGLINTNVNRFSDKYIANVTAIDLKIANKSNSYAITSKGGISNISEQKEKKKQQEYGHFYNIDLEKISGKFRFKYTHLVESDKYNPNDLGYLQSNNEFTNRLMFEHYIFKPVWRIVSMNNNFAIRHTMRFSPREYYEIIYSANSYVTFRNYLTIGLNLSGAPIERHDYYEPRVDNRIYKDPDWHSINLYFSTDYRKKIAFDIWSGTWSGSQKKLNGYWIGLSPRIRFSDKFFVSTNHNFDFNFNNNGYADDFGEDSVFFGRRNIATIINTINASYIFNNHASLTMRIRHYFTNVDYDKYYFLQENGDIIPTTKYKDNCDVNFNSFNIDLQYTWQFSHGSELSVVWKNAISEEKGQIVKKYLDNIRNTFEANQINNLSLKILYYIDYQYIKRKRNQNISNKT